MSMSRHGRKRQLDVESRYWRLLMSGLDGYTTSRQRGSGMPPTMTYGQRPRWADVYARVAATGTDLRGQLEALVQTTLRPCGGRCSPRTAAGRGRLDDPGDGRAGEGAASRCRD